jgi:hypothetical protein
MINHTPDGWRLQRRGPQHAAPFGSSAPLHAHGVRALRLVVAAGAWGAGLCLIVGLVTMVARAAQPRALASDTAGDSQRTSAGVDAGLNSGTLTGKTDYRVTRTFQGAGTHAIGPFAVAPHSPWQLDWSYRCARAAGRGRLLILDGSGADEVSVDAAGAAGSGSTWAYSTARRHDLMVFSSCAWVVTVIVQR